MEKKVITIQMPKEIVKYVANDGTEFGSEEECKKYEETARCAINAAIAKIVKKKCYTESILSDSAPWNWESTFYLIPIRNANDVEIVNKWILDSDAGESNCISTNDIGKEIVFEDEPYGNYRCPCGTIEEMISEFRKALMKHLGKETQEENV